MTDVLVDRPITIEKSSSFHLVITSGKAGGLNAREPLKAV